MKGEKINWSIIITTKNRPIRSHSSYIYPWKHTSSFQDTNLLIEKKIWRKLTFRDSIR